MNDSQQPPRTPDAHRYRWRPEVAGATASPQPHLFTAACNQLRLHPFVVATVLGVDQMLGAMEIGSMFVLTLVSFVVAAVMVLPIALIQRNSYGDDGGTALGKAICLALVTAIPTGLPTLFLAGWIGITAKRERDRRINGNPDDHHYGDN